MSNGPEWDSMPAALDAARTGDYATILRLARTAARWTLEQAGERTGYSPSTLSRLETGRRRTCDPKELRRLAQVYEIPFHLLGLSTTPDAATATNLADPDEGGDPMRRRDLLASGVLAVTAAALTPLDPVAAATRMSETLEDVLSGRSSAASIPAAQLEAQLAAAAADFRDCRYTQLTHRLPRLLATATAGQQQAPIDQDAVWSGRLARAYNITTDLLTKLHDDAMAWATADRAMQAALTCGDPLIVAETTRLKTIVLRRTRHQAGAQRLVITAGEQLANTTKLTEPAQAALYAQLLATAAYTAAINDDRGSAQSLIHEAETAHIPDTTAGRVGMFTSLDVAIYKIGIARALGDYGKAVHHARLIDPARITSPTRRARYWEDTALALHGRGRPAATYQALLAAERVAPQEVQYRPWAQQLTRELVANDTRHALPGVRDLAQRIGATI